MSGIINEHVGQVLTLLGFVIGGLWGGVKLFNSQKSDKPAGSIAATNEMLAGLIRSVDQKLEIGVREQSRNYDSIDRRLDDMRRELIEINTRLELR